MGLSRWVDAAHRDAYWRAYDASLSLWPIPWASTFVETSHGPTHVVRSGVASGSPIVLLHAASMSAVQWHAQAAELGRRHSLFAVDIVGDIGRSTQTAPIRTRAAAACWLASLLDALGLGRAALVGSSFGGFVAANLAVLDPARVGALVLLAPAATLQPFSLAAKAFIRLGSLVPLPSTVRPGLRAMMGGDLPDERIVRQMEAGVAGFRYDRAGVFPGKLADAELQRIRCPTLVLVGDGERIYDPGSAIGRARVLIRDVTAEVLPGLGHLLAMQDAPRVNARIGAFLERHGDGGPPAHGDAAT
jgi:pimeloyl-ACP methyl ester carboxylesterase